MRIVSDNLSKDALLEEVRAAGGKGFTDMAVYALPDWETKVEPQPAFLIHIACERGDLEIVRILLEAGADMNPGGEPWTIPDLTDLACQIHVEPEGFKGDEKEWNNFPFLTLY